MDKRELTDSKNKDAKKAKTEIIEADSIVFDELQDSSMVFSSACIKLTGNDMWPTRQLFYIDDDHNYAIYGPDHDGDEANLKQ